MSHRRQSSLFWPLSRMLCIRTQDGYAFANTPVPQTNFPVGVHLGFQVTQSGNLADRPEGVTTTPARPVCGLADMVGRRQSRDRRAARRQRGRDGKRGREGGLLTQWKARIGRGVSLGENRERRRPLSSAMPPCGQLLRLDFRFAGNTTAPISSVPEHLDGTPRAMVRFGAPSPLVDHDDAAVRVSNGK